MFKIFIVPQKIKQKKTHTKIIKIKKIFFDFFGPTRIVPRSYVFPSGKSGIT